MINSVCSGSNYANINCCNTTFGIAWEYTSSSQRIGHSGNQDIFSLKKCAP